MNKLIMTVSVVILSITLSYAQQADAIIGKYHLPNKLDVEIFEYDKKYFGKIIALNGYEDGQTTDYKNPNKAKHNDRLIGKVIITNLEYDSDEKKWINGKMYGPEKGLFFNLKITEHRNTEIEIVASKYLFWKTMEWEKI